MQNVVAIPLVVPPQAAGAVVPSTDGAFLLSFGSEGPDLPDAEEPVTNPAGLWAGPTMPFSPVLQSFRPGANAATAELAEAGRGQAVPVPDVGRADPDLAQLLGPIGPELAAERVTPGSTDHAGSDPHDKEQDPENIIDKDSELPALLSAQAVETSFVGTSRAIPLGPHDQVAGAMKLIAAMPRASTAGLIAGLADGQRALGLTAKTVPSATEADPWAGPAGDPSASLPRGIDDWMTGLPGTAKDSASAAVVPRVIGNAETASEPSRGTRDPQLALDPGEAGAAKGSGKVGQSDIATPQPSDRSVETGLAGAGALSANEHIMAQSLGVKLTRAQPPVLPADGTPDNLAIDQAIGDSSDPMSRPHATNAAMQDPLTALRPQSTATVAGFWERLLTGISVSVPGDPSSGDSVGPTDASAGRRKADEGDQLSGPTPTAKPLNPAALVETASSQAVFARGLAQLADPSSDPGRESDVAEQTLAALALPGALPPGLSLPQPSAAAPAHFPLLHVATQITAALTQSADGATELALSPEELGRVRLRLERDVNHPDRMVVHITFERPETLDLFRRHAGELAEALREAGYAGADIGFGQQDSGTDAPPREGTSAGTDYTSAVGGPAEAHTPDSSASRRMAGASLDLRL